MADSKWATNLGWSFIALGFFSSIIFPPLGFGCCFLGAIFLAIGGMQAVQNTGFDQGSVKLVQNEAGQWVWGASANQNGSIAYNSQDNQILSRVIKEIRDGKSLNTLEDNELDILANAYGITSGSAMQKIEALENSELAASALLLGSTAGSVAMVDIPEPVTAKSKVEQIKQIAKEKVSEELNVDVDEIIESDSNEVNDILLDQLSKEIRKRDLTPKGFIELADLNQDDSLDAMEIAGALTAAIGMTIPVFLIQNTLSQFDIDNDEKLNVSELNLLWDKLGIEYEDEIVEEEVIEEEVIEKEIETEQEVEEVVSEEIEITENIHEENLVDEYAEEIVEEIEPTENQNDEVVLMEEPKESSEDLTSDIDTDFERFIVELSEAVLSSDRRNILKRQTHGYTFSFKISKFERTLLGNPEYRGGQSIHGLIDGGPFEGVVRIPKSMDETILNYKEGSSVNIQGSISDYMPSLNRCVIDATHLF